MKLNSLLAKPFAGLVYKGIRKSMMTAVADQEKILQELLKGAKGTEFGKEFSFPHHSKAIHLKTLLHRLHSQLNEERTKSGPFEP